MIEARIFTGDLDEARRRLEVYGAKSQGSYKINDDIYRNIDETVTLAQEFLRLREVPENIWNEKPVILALKQTELRRVGKHSRIPLKLQFDTKAEAEAYYRQHLETEYVFDYSFSRIGWQYFLPGGEVVDLEILEDTYPSIEFKSATDEGMKELLGRFAVSESDVMKGPSVVAFKRVLGR